MQSRLFSSLLMTSLILLLSVHMLSGGRIAAAQSTAPTWKRNVKEKPAPTPRRRPVARRPVRREEAAPLLSVQFRIIKVNPNNSQIEINPLTAFNAGDRLRFAVKANQNVYLYVIQQKGPDQMGRFFFPDSRISGQNLVTKDQDFVVPSNCQSSASFYDCSYEVDSSAVQEFLTFIFSRNATLSLSNNVAVISNEVTPQALNYFLDASNQKLDTTQHGDTIFSLRVSNLNPRADEKIIVRYVLNKRGRALSD